ncbi:hypothetical protein UCREL1_3265 [Eutypa lata UCREL1]|uniref:Uncharacterized protein n=1 Tax=Eutypa lata (strain UCR-EL1) TaxID=1287681 RepID=M7TID9_EUTLA|nr:hypothetical protein UCREL1_3265 [Eutypa lata UCREL1]
MLIILDKGTLKDMANRLMSIAVSKWETITKMDVDVLRQDGQDETIAQILQPIHSVPKRLIKGIVLSKDQELGNFDPTTSDDIDLRSIKHKEKTEALLETLTRMKAGLADGIQSAQFLSHYSCFSISVFIESQVYMPDKRWYDIKNNQVYWLLISVMRPASNHRNNRHDVNGQFSSGGSRPGGQLDDPNRDFIIDMVSGKLIELKL